jgi:hypothetical protein
LKFLPHEVDDRRSFTAIFSLILRRQVRITHYCILTYLPLHGNRLVQAKTLEPVEMAVVRDYAKQWQVRIMYYCILTYLPLHGNGLVQAKTLEPVGEICDYKESHK